jgi:hypothetical protein
MVATLLCEEWDVTSPFFDGEALEGPVPRLFTADLEAAKAAFETNLELAYKDVSKILGRFFIAENLDRTKTMAYLHNPK